MFCVEIAFRNENISFTLLVYSPSGMYGNLSILSEKDSDLVIELVNKLYNELKEGKMLGRNCKSKRRSSILKTIFTFLDVKDSAPLLLTLSRLILAMRVSNSSF